MPREGAPRDVVEVPPPRVTGVPRVGAPRDVVEVPRVVGVAVVLPRPQARVAMGPREEVVAARPRFVLPCGIGKLHDDISGPENNLAAEQVSGKC